MLKSGDKIGIVACSNGLDITMKEKIFQLSAIFKEMALEPVYSPYLFAKENVLSGTGKERARALEDFYRAPSIKMIFDISGGDLANEVLSYLDFKVILDNPKPFWGYSDLTTILNAIYTKTKGSSYLYQVRHLAGAYQKQQKLRFRKTVLEGQNDLLDIDYDFLQQHEMEGVVIGGNIRCFLKLAGTPFMPDFNEKILLLEAMGGKTPQMLTYLNQLKQLGAFEKINGILLGTFTALEADESQIPIVELVKRVVERPELPIAKTCDIGHGADAKAVMIGRYLRLRG